MKTIQVRYYSDDRGLCKTIFKEVGQDRYFNRISGKGGAWYTVYPSQGYWENCGLVSDDILFEVADSKETVLFTEGNGTDDKPFQAVWDMAKEQSVKWAEKLSLKPYEEWKACLLTEQKACKDDDYYDHWLYGKAECTNSTVLNSFEHLGLGFAIIQKEYIHRICGKQWLCITVHNLETGTCEAVCGYVFQ